MTYEQISGDLKKKIYHPVYFLHGEEPYYIDLISDYIEHNVLSESEKEFNQTILYGKDVDVPTLISYARRYPMMSSYQVIILKEAQDLKNLIIKNKEDKDLFVEYLLKPTTTTILVLCYKYNKLDGRSKLSKTLDKNAVTFESKKLYDSQLPAWISKFAEEKKLKINSKAVQLLAENLGNDLTKIANEIAKVSRNTGNQEITVAHVAENIGISKDFNVFELINAITDRNALKAFRIAEYFGDNPKQNPYVLTITQLYSFFMKVLTYHQLEDRSKNNAASALGVNPYYLNDYIKASQEYPRAHCLRNIGYLREYDLRNKGVNNGLTEDKDLLKEIIYKILN